VVWVTALGPALRRTADRGSGDVAVGAAQTPAPERMIPIEMDGEGISRWLSNDMAPAVKGIRVLSALGPQPIAPMLTPVSDGALLCYRNPEQLHRLR